MRPPTVRLSLSMIVKDEEEFIGGCLESVRGIVDEIVVVDTGSTDKTIEIARNAGAQVLQENWNGDFACARNRSLEACTGRWVLYLDADERLVAGQKEKILGLLAVPKVDAYQILVRSALSLKGGKRAVQVMPYPRLFRRKEGVRFERPVHEQIAPSILRRGGKIVPADVVIEHLGYDQGFDVLKQKVLRNLGTLLALAEQNAGDWYSRFQLARSFMLVQDFPAVVYHAGAAIRTPGVPVAIQCSLHNLLAEAALKTRNIGQAIHNCERSLALFPEQSGAMWFLAGSYMTQGNPRPAIPVLESLLLLNSSRERSAIAVEDLVIPSDAVAEALGRCHFSIGNWEGAAEAFASALRYNPLFPGAGERLIETLKRLRHPESALRCLRKATEGEKVDMRLLSYRAMVENEAGQDTRALETLDRILAANALDPVALSLKALWSLRKKDFAAAAETIRRAEENNVASDDIARCAFELAVQEGNFSDALVRLEKIERLFSPDDYKALKSKVSRLVN